MVEPKQTVFKNVEFAILTISNSEKPIVSSGPTTYTLPVYKRTGLQLHPRAERGKRYLRFMEFYEKDEKLPRSFLVAMKPTSKVPLAMAKYLKDNLDPALRPVSSLRGVESISQIVRA